ncbi:N-acetylmuramoyl-L-alanine amidase [Streptomyces sp. NBC_00663]|uniref:peptidoglycan recognition protein family protein n=1 Tax=Streptomyces sp. NBC_00663 TaxID=2975801 RepID=UPI002E320049|nr:N-acetylmuramoyl-L-alanine amidase [Streptomyces sp. NBC_00663]
MRRRWWGAAALTAVTVTGALVVQGMTGGPSESAADDGKSRPVRSTNRAAELTVAADGTSARLAKRDTADFSLLGLTWSDPSARVGAKIEARARDTRTGTWSTWLTLDTDNGPGEDGATRGGTEPAWVGPSDGVEVRVDGKASARLPEGLRLDMVDPGTSTVSDAEPAAFALDATESPTATPADSPSPGTATPSADASDGTATPSVSPSTSTTFPAPTAGSASPTPTASAGAPASTVPQPPITSRAGWGADESISPQAPEYLPSGRIKAVTVHHTVDSNDYTCAEAPAVVRGIYAYHVKTLGWRDIGYNFLVDKCGTVYEGRKGGVDQPVLGAHTYGFNTQTTGISVLGTYTDTAPSTAAMTSVARIAAWKLARYGVDPDGTTTLTAGATGGNFSGRTWAQGDQLDFPTIIGHRDGYNTECPGTAFYAELPTIRSWAAGPVTGLALKSVTGSGTVGSTTYTKASVTLNWSITSPAAFVSRYEVLVDGKVAATAAGTATSAKATPAVGTHKVAVRAVHQSGKTATTATATVVAETTAPTFSTKPSPALRTGTVSTTAVPLTLKWKATDSAALKEVRLTAPATATYGPATTSTLQSARSATATTWSLKAYDQAGNTATASVSGTPVILQETSATRSGTWTAKSSYSYLGGASYSSKTKNSSLSWTFTGRSAAWVVSRASTSGQAYVYVDGTKVATVDLRSTTTAYRNAIWAKTWSSSAKHTVKIVVVATSGRPTVTTDGLVYLK